MKRRSKTATFVTGEEGRLFALNRKARRIARRYKFACTSVPMPCLLKTDTGYMLQTKEGALLPYTPYGPNRTEDAPQV